jgi:hypothetical protein
MSTRRDLLAFTAGAVAARTVLPLAAKATETHPDAELIRICGAFDATWQQYCDCCFDADPGSPEEDLAMAEQAHYLNIMKDLAKQMYALRASTQDGLVARVRSQALWEQYTVAEEESAAKGTIDDIFKVSIMRDVLAMGNVKA